MSRLEDRQTLANPIKQACAEGARLQPARELAGIDPGSLRCWQGGDGPPHADRRPDAIHPTPAHALTEAERAQIIEVANQPRFADAPPARIVPALADAGVHIASESSFQRVLRAHGQMNHRGRARPPRASRPPTTHLATAPRQVWCWDVTFLPTLVQGRWFSLSMILDIDSRKIVGFAVHATDSAHHAVQLAKRAALAEGLHGMDVTPVPHGDNGATIKATTVTAMLDWLGIKPSHSRPRVSDDNAFAEAFFRTAKYRPEFPANGFSDRDAARDWAARFVHWYNNQHRHGGIRYVTPAQRHDGQDKALLAARHELYQEARQRNPARWTGQTREWTPVTAVTLNPERDSVVQASLSPSRLSSSIGEPAFPSRPGKPQATERNEGAWAAKRTKRSAATRSHAQRALSREHGEHGEHRTFPAVSTVAHSVPVEGDRIGAGCRPKGRGG
jgi:transposase InsO family protein